MNQCLCFFNALLKWFSFYCWTWIYSKRRSGFFRHTCQCFCPYTLCQICMDVKACLHHGYAIVMHSCDLIKKQRNTPFLMGVHREFLMYPQKMLYRALLTAVFCYVTLWSSAACSGSLESVVRVTCCTYCWPSWRSVSKISVGNYRGQYCFLLCFEVLVMFCLWDVTCSQAVYWLN